MKAKTAWILALVGLGAVLWQWVAHAQEILAFAQAWAGASKGFVRENQIACWLGILALGAVAINCPLPLAALVKVLSGYFFGTFWGFTLNVCLSCAGGLIGFVAVRHLFYHALYSRFSRQLAKANMEIARNGFWFVLSARLIMATPFFMVNVLAGLSCIRKRKFLLGTFLGVLPSSAIYAVSGSRLETFRSLSDLADPQFALALALLGAAATLPALVRHAKAKRP